MKSCRLCLSLVAIFCMATITLGELIENPNWEGEGGSGDCMGSSASAYASGDEDYDENCASGSYDILTTVAGDFSASYNVDASAWAAYITYDEWGSWSEAHGSCCGSASGAPMDTTYISAVAHVYGGPGYDSDSDEPDSDYDSFPTWWFEAYQGMSAWHTVYAWAKILPGSDNVAWSDTSAHAAVSMSPN